MRLVFRRAVRIYFFYFDVDCIYIYIYVESILYDGEGNPADVAKFIIIVCDKNLTLTLDEIARARTMFVFIWKCGRIIYIQRRYTDSEVYIMAFLCSAIFFHEANNALCEEYIVHIGLMLLMAHELQWQLNGASADFKLC